jgi:hypothetical protein
VSRFASPHQNRTSAFSIIAPSRTESLSFRCARPHHRPDLTSPNHTHLSLTTTRPRRSYRLIFSSRDATFFPSPLPPPKPRYHLRLTPPNHVVTFLSPCQVALAISFRCIKPLLHVCLVSPNHDVTFLSRHQVVTSLSSRLARSRRNFRPVVTSLSSRLARSRRNFRPRHENRAIICISALRSGRIVSSLKPHRVATSLAALSRKLEPHRVATSFAVLSRNRHIRLTPPRRDPPFFSSRHIKSCHQVATSCGFHSVESRHFAFTAPSRAATFLSLY